MKTIIYDKAIQKVPVKIWAPEGSVEPQAIQQLKNTASLPFVFKQVAAMPDVHLGIGATVGSVVATKGAVIPAAVGVDIGCGMMALRLEVPPQKILDKCDEVRLAIESVIPVGFAGNNPDKLTASVGLWEGWDTWKDLNAKDKFERDLKGKAVTQLGSLGGGNHFIELCTDTEGKIWVMLHSGSRGIGNMLARIHMDKAKGDMKRMFITLADPDLAYFVEGTDDYLFYMADLLWAQAYAAENREEMMRRILFEIGQIIDLESVPFSHKVNCHHNYASMENHYGENVLITRKGAVRARVGDFGIIPGSMGTKSYIVEGLGNPESFNSCSHGAGRRMSRTQARKQFTVDDLKAQTEGVDCRKDDGVLDEIPGAYKDIDEVMENQKDLVKVVAQLKQFLCVKG